MLDTLIIGCGIAGATAALRLSDDPKRQITIITRAADPADSNTAWAQGGIVTRGLDDNPDLLVEDIMRAGAGVGSIQAARLLASEGPQLVQSVLVERCGVNFDTDEQGETVYGLEGAHSRRRVVHVGDQTGKAIAERLLATLAERDNVTLLSQHTALDLITLDDACAGAYVLDRETGDVETLCAAQTILATGGIGQVYAHTSNPVGARGDGVAMAARAGARIADAEYVQFHPTAMPVAGPNHLLISEAVRGEGAVLLTPEGRPFMADYAPEWRDLAPRDVVARAIHHEIQVNGYEHVLLDIASKRPAAFIRERFPQLVENCALVGLDATRDPLPVVPAAHYFCGGVHVDAWGRTNIDGLYAIGEASRTGLHGANRLASTSLLEGLVWGDRAARHIARANRPQIAARSNQPIYGQDAPDSDQIARDLHDLRHLMWEHVGIVRTEGGLSQAEQQLDTLAARVEATYRHTRPDDTLTGLRNAIMTGRLITRAARQNRTSRGAHYRADHVAAKTA